MILGMNTTNSIDWVLCLAWSMGHAILTALVDRAPVNAVIAYDAILMNLGSNIPARWVGRCKACELAHRIDGVIARGRTTGRGDAQIIISGTRAYLCADQGTNTSAVSIVCCAKRVKLSRVYDSHKPNRPRHECNAKCLGSTGPACECKCGGANHGSSAHPR